MTILYPSPTVKHAKSNGICQFIIISDFLLCMQGRSAAGEQPGSSIFLFFFNDLPYSLNCDADAYAGDTSMTSSGGTVDKLVK